MGEYEQWENDYHTIDMDAFRFYIPKFNLSRRLYVRTMIDGFALHKDNIDNLTDVLDALIEWNNEPTLLNFDATFPANVEVIKKHPDAKLYLTLPIWGIREENLRKLLDFCDAHFWFEDVEKGNFVYDYEMYYYQIDPCRGHNISHTPPTNMSNENKKTRFNCRIDKELLDDYKKVVPNASEDIREYMQRRVNQKTNLQELQKIRLDKIKERDMLNIEIEELEEEIAEAKHCKGHNISHTPPTPVKEIIKDTKLTEIQNNIDNTPFNVLEERICSYVRLILFLNELDCAYSITLRNIVKAIKNELEIISNNDILIQYVPSHNGKDMKHELTSTTEYGEKILNRVTMEWENDVLNDLLVLNEELKLKKKFENEEKVRKPISGRIRQNVLMRDNYTCQICGATVKDGAKLEIDHIKPVSKGGTNDENNLQVLCQQCNREKHNRDDLLHDKRKLAELEGK